MTRASAALESSAPAAAAAPGSTFDGALARVRLWTVVPSVVVPCFVAGMALHAIRGSASGHALLPASAALLIQYVVFHAAVLVWCLAVLPGEAGSLGRLLGSCPSTSERTLICLVTASKAYVRLFWLSAALGVWGSVPGWESSSPPERPWPGLLAALSGTVATVLVAPFVEELLFRGILFRTWRQRWGERWGAWGAALGSSAAFGLLHADILGAGFSGLLMLLLYTRTGTLWAPIAAHALHNALFEALQYYSWLAPTPTPTLDRLVPSFSHWAWPHVLWSALLLLSGGWLALFVHRSWPALGKALPPAAGTPAAAR